VKALIIRPSGAIDTGNLPDGPEDVLKFLYHVIGCDTVTVVTLAPQVIMWLDDEGMVNGSPVNPVATKIAAACGWGGQPYFGTAVITRRTPGGATAGLPEEAVRKITAILRGSGATTDDARQEPHANGEG